MARRGRRPSNPVVLMLAGLVAAILVLYPVLVAFLWWQADPVDISIVVYNATVPTAERRQQRAVDLVLEHLKVTGARFVGAAPGGVDVGAWPDEAPDVVFLVDAYGVYLDDVGSDSTAATVLLTRPLGDPVTPDLENWVKAGTLVYGEYNIMHAPTPPDVSERLQAVFGVDALGWVGRWYSDLSEVGDNIRRAAGSDMPVDGPGLVLIAQSVGSVTRPEQIVVISGDDLLAGPPLISGRSPEGRDLAGIAMFDWFSLMEPDDQTDVVMWLDLPIAGSATDALAGLGISPRIPLLITGDTTAYFAANMSRTSAEFPTRRLLGALDVMQALPQSDDAESFYRVTAPVIRSIIERG